MGYVRGRKQRRAGFWWGKVKDKDHLEDLGVDGRITLTFSHRSFTFKF